MLIFVNDEAHLQGIDALADLSSFFVAFTQSEITSNHIHGITEVISLLSRKGVSVIDEGKLLNLLLQCCLELPRLPLLLLCRLLVLQVSISLIRVGHSSD